jgi:outer membrane protein TolC
MVMTKRTMQIIVFVVVIGSFFWLINYHPGHVTLAAAADSPQVTNIAKAPNATETKLHQLLLERKQILQNIVDTIANQYKLGVTDMEQLQQAKINLLNADLDLDKTPAERINIRSQIVQLYKEAEDSLTTQVAAGRATELELEKAKVARLTEQIELVKEQLAAKSTTK